MFLRDKTTIPIHTSVHRLTFHAKCTTTTKENTSYFIPKVTQAGITIANAVVALEIQ